MLPEISVVVPVYGCADCLQTLHDRLTETLSALVDEYELIFVDDGSQDGGWAKVEEMAGRDDRVIAIKLSRNFGQHAAITAGMTEARGRWVVVMDCDLQHPPEEIPRLFAAAVDGGYDIVFTRRRGVGHTWSRRAASRLYFSLMNRVLKTDMKSDFSNFSIISRQVADEFLRIRDRDRQYLMILYWLGFKSTAVEFDFRERHSGESTYSFPTLVRFAFDGLFFQTTALLRWIVYLGFALSLAGAAVAAYFVVHYLASGSRYPGWTSLIVLFLMVGGFIIVSTGVAALYIGKIFGQVKERPLFVVETRRSVKTLDSKSAADNERVHAPLSQPQPERPPVRIALVAEPQGWFVPYVRQFAEELRSRGHDARVVSSYDDIPSGTEISFFLGCTRVATPEQLARSRHNVVIHQSALPEGRGWSPLSWQVLEGKREIPVTAFEAAPGVDEGDVYLRGVIRLEGHELCEELRELQARSDVDLALELVGLYPNLVASRQSGAPTYYERRTPVDNRLDPERSLAEQFDLLRICDNDRYPAFFELRGHRYVLKIEKAHS